MNEKTITISTELTDQQAWDLAQFFKRVSFSDVRSNAVDNDEAYRMLDAINRIAKALREAGFCPR